MLLFRERELLRVKILRGSAPLHGALGIPGGDCAPRSHLGVPGGDVSACSRFGWGLFRVHSLGVRTEGLQDKLARVAAQAVCEEYPAVM